MGRMNPDWLSQLVAAHAPAPIGWWPPAPGWWGLAALLAAACIGWLVYRHRPAQRMRRAALRELERLAHGNTDDVAFACGLERLLRRYSVTRFGREAIASLVGEEWLAFVVAHGGAQLAGATGTNLLCMAFGGTANAERQVWFAAARAFIKDKS
jgi:hypothetical protein